MRRAVEVISKVLPSGAARDTASVPITALAPGRFSVNKVTPSVRLICSARIRARMSAVPPAGYGTTSLTVLAVCDDAPVSPRRIERAPAAARQRDRRLGRFMMMPPKCVVSTAYQRPADGPRALPLPVHGTERAYLDDLLHVRFRGEAERQDAFVQWDGLA